MPLVRTPRTHHDRVAAHSRVEDGVAEEVVMDVPDTDPREPPAPPAAPTAVQPLRAPERDRHRRVVRGVSGAVVPELNVAQHKGLTLVSVSAEAR